MNPKIEAIKDSLGIDEAENHNLETSIRRRDEGRPHTIHTDGKEKENGSSIPTVIGSKMKNIVLDSNQVDFRFRTRWRILYNSLVQKQRKENLWVDVQINIEEN